MIRGGAAAWLPPRRRGYTRYPMPLRIEEYALVGDTETAGLVGSDGSLDWLCAPRFDSPACFAALLGDERHGHWRIAPCGGARRVERRYRPDTLILETDFHTADGVVRLIDFMPPRDETPDVVRIVEGISGRVRLRMELVIRFDYGRVVPWVRREQGRLLAVAGPDALTVSIPVDWRGENFVTTAEFDVAAGDRPAFQAIWHQSHRPAPRGLEAETALASTEAWWREWSRCHATAGRLEHGIDRSLITLKALTYAPTGGIVAAPTTSLPEQLGGVRNWDYRFCWLRDATLTLLALLDTGHISEARAWRDWLLRSVAGRPDEIQIMYGPAGERRLTEWVVEELPGYEGARPVRVGNAASSQFQLDVYGEVTDALHQARVRGLEPDPHAWRLQLALLDFLEDGWRRDDEGIWEVRGPSRPFVHSKLMAWAAFDRAAASVERFGLDGPADRWKRLREDVRGEILERGWDRDRNTFTQYYGSQALDAALLMIPQIGFLPATDPRFVGTVEAIERELCVDGFVLRYPTDESDGLPPGEGAFLPCSFWLVDALALIGRRDEAETMLRRLLALRNDVGLLSEEYDVDARRLVGNFPQAFTHVALVNSALNMGAVPAAPSRERPRAS